MGTRRGQMLTVGAYWVLSLLLFYGLPCTDGRASVTYTSKNEDDSSEEAASSVLQDQLIVQTMVTKAKPLCKTRSENQGFKIQVREHVIPDSTGGGSVRGLLFFPLRGIQDVVRCKPDLLSSKPSSWDQLERCANSRVDLTCLCCEAGPCEMDPDYSINVVKFLSTIGMSLLKTNYNNYRHVEETEQRVLIIGLGAGSLPALLARYFKYEIDVVEPDTTIIDLASECFGFPGTSLAERVHVYNQTAHDFLQSGEGASRLYDVIFLDPFTNTNLIYGRATLEFLKLAQSRMQPGASMVTDFAKVTEGCYSRELATYHEAFGNLYLFQVPGQPLTRILVSTNCLWKDRELPSCQDGGTLDDLVNSAVNSNSQYFTLYPPKDYLRTAELYTPPPSGTPYSSFLEGKFPPPECLFQDAPAAPR